MPLVKDTELELLVPMEKVGNPRRSMSSLQDVPVFTDAAWQEVQSAFGFPHFAHAPESLLVDSLAGSAADRALSITDVDC